MLTVLFFPYACSNDHAHAEWIAIARVSYIAIANARVMTSKQSQPLSLESHEEHMNVLKPLWNALLQDCLAFKGISVCFLRVSRRSAY